MNKLYVGLTRTVAIPASGLYIHDEVPEIRKALIFDPRLDGFNPLQNIDYRKAREIADVLYTLYPQGEGTLTVRNGRRALLQALLLADRLDRVKGDDEVSGLLADILTSPLLRKVLCKKNGIRKNQNMFHPEALVLARINRAELGEFDALVLGLLLLAHFKGQVVVPDFGFYGREAHVSLIREERLIAGVSSLRELPPKLRQNVLLIKEKEPSGATYEDAETLALYAGLRPDPLRADNPYNDFVKAAMAY